MDFENFDLLISDPAIARLIGAPGDLRSDPVELPVDVGDLAERYARLVQRRNLSEKELIDYGKELFNLLMQGELDDLFNQCAGIARAQTKILRLRLHLESAALAHLPWELLYTQGDFLAIHPSFSISRYLPANQPRSSLPIQLPLRILVLISAPDDLPDLDIEAEEQALRSGLQTMLATRSVELVFEKDARRQRLLERMQAETWHVLHFVGHGDYQADRGLVYLLGPDHHGDPLEAVHFAEILAASPSLRLVTLNACATAYEHAQRGFSSVASQLVRRGMPAVIAMRNAIEDRVAITFTNYLFGNLATGEAVDVALTRARQQLRQERSASPIVFALPILYLNIPDAALFQIVNQHKKRLASAAQQIVMLSEICQTLTEWKELHEMLHSLDQWLNSVQENAYHLQLISQRGGWSRLRRKLAAWLGSAEQDPSRAYLQSLQNGWAQFRQTLDGLLVPFASQRIQRIGKRYQMQGDQSSVGEEWVVGSLEVARLIDQAIESQSLDPLLERLGAMQGLLHKHLRICNRRMVGLLGEVIAAYQGMCRILEELRSADQAAGIDDLNWAAIQVDLDALRKHSERIPEWISLHDLFDTLQKEFAVIAASGVTEDSLEQLAAAWQRLRDDAILTLLEQAAQISHIERAFLRQEDGSSSGAPWAVVIKHHADHLDEEIHSRDLEKIRKAILELNKLIQTQYLLIDRNVKNEMTDFTNYSGALKARVTP